MKAGFINSYGGPEVLELGTITDPIPTKGTVLVSVRATSINPIDYKIRSGMLKFISGKVFPKVLGSDFSGVVASVGEGVTDFKVGESVYGSVPTFMGKQGAQAELVVAPVKNIRYLTQKMNFEIAASLPVAALTALNGLRQCGDLSGKKVLVNGATGGVGHFVVQMAKAKGAEVTAVCSAKNAGFAKELGANDVIDYAKSNVIAGERKFDIIFDASAKLNFKDASNILTKKGYFISPILTPIISSFKKLFYSVLGGKKLIPGDMRARPEDYVELEALLSEGKVKAVIGQVFPLAQLKDAVATVENGKAKGKIIVKI